MGTGTLEFKEGMLVRHPKHSGFAVVVRVFEMSVSENIFVRVRKLDGSEVLVRAEELAPVKTDFRIGGSACWRDPDKTHNSHSAGFIRSWRAKFGEGPFRVKDIQPTPGGELLTVVMPDGEHHLSDEFFVPANN